MSASSAIKYSLIITGLFALPFFASAKTITFGDSSWDAQVTFVQATKQAYITNGFSLLDLAQASLSQKALTQPIHLLDTASVTALEEIINSVNQPAVNAQLDLIGDSVKEFNPGQNGQTINFANFLEQLNSGSDLINLPVIVSEPAITLADTNQLGIIELVAEGESNFTGSPNNRIHNISVGAAKYKSLLISPGEEFSFNKFLGDVDGEHGFLPELVIKPGGVVPEFGGGLCQVSTTAFRAAMKAGLPITARRNHSFAVQYYAPQGTDATIYPGSSDLKFINNLSSHLLITSRIEGKHLYFDYYGTKDDRAVTFDGPTVYDRKPDGSMKATWIRHVTQNDQTTTQTFNSTYLPPALFHHDSVEQSSTPNPQAAPPAPTSPVTLLTQ